MVKVPVSATVVVPATVSLTIVLRRLEILVGPFDGRSRHVFLLRREKSQLPKQSAAGIDPPNA